MRIPVYPAEIEEQMRNFYNSLSEKQRRCYAAVEATKLGYGGITYLGSVLPYDAGTVALGREEIKKPLPEQEQNIRKPGGGRKSRLAVTVGLDAAFLEVLRNYTAGLPTNETIKRTNLTRGEIAKWLTERGFPVSQVAR